ncbi:hypothetical protein JOQ06_018419, partial [Pogonophryne albipinna]
MEGVTGLSSGSKFSQGRSSYQTEPQARVTLNICSRCARLQGDSLSDGRSEECRPISSEQAVPDISAPLPGVDAVAGRLQEFDVLSQVSYADTITGCGIARVRETSLRWGLTLWLHYPP